MRAATLALADVHRITTRLKGRTVEVFVFDHHRTAFTLWCDAATRLGSALTLVTLDRHMDLGIPKALAPDHRSPLEALDAFARHRLAPSNDDHIVAAMEAGAIDDALVIARSHRPPDLAIYQPFRDRRGATHPVGFADTVDAITPEQVAALRKGGPIVLDVDLDCFTTLSDGHLDEVLTWDRERIEDFLLPPDSAPFWDAALERTRLITLAREPYHCGGFARGARLWIDFAEVFFEKVLGVPPP